MFSNRKHIKYLFIAIFLGTIYLAYLLLKPFITAILTSALLAYIFYPLYYKIYKKTNKENLSAFAVSVIIVLIVALPFAYIITGLAKEATVLVKSMDKLTDNNLVSAECDKSKILCKSSERIRDDLSDPKIRSYVEDGVKKVTSAIIDKTSEFLLSLPDLLLNLFMIIFLVFYLFKEGPILAKWAENLLPIKNDYKTNLVKKINDSIYAILFGSIILAVIQGVFAAIGYYIVGMDSVILWSIITMLFALVPFVGTAIVWGPASLYFIAIGIMTSDSILIVKGIGLLLYGIFIISSIDNIIRPKLIGSRAGIHPILVLFGVIGGVALFGMIGVIVGPLVFALLIAFIEIYEKER